MVRNIILIILMLLFNACASKYDRKIISSNEIMQSQYITFHPPKEGWETYKENENYYDYDIPLTLNKDNFTFKIVFRTHPYKDAPFYNNLFNKDAQFSDSDKKKEVYDTTDKEMGISYKRHWQVYVHGLKCSGGVYAQSFGGSAYSAISKNYSIGCGYYDKEKGKRLLDISYRYYGGMGNTELQGDKDEKKSKNLTPKEAEAYLKASLKEIIQTLKIKRFDKEKMIQEGLYYPNKKFESTKW